MTALLRFLLTVAALLMATSAWADDTPARSLQGEPLLTALRGGGLIVYFRHTSTDFAQNDDQMTGFEDCSKQRNLTEQGRAEARALGSVMRRLQLPIGDVLASPFCRTMETAQLVFGRAKREAAVRGGPATAAADPDRYRELRAILSAPPRAGTDLAVVSHGNPYNAVVGPPYLAEGEAAVIEPQGAGRFRVLARLKKADWDALGAKLSTGKSK